MYQKFIRVLNDYGFSFTQAESVKLRCYTLDEDTYFTIYNVVVVRVKGVSIFFEFSLLGHVMIWDNNGKLMNIIEKVQTIKCFFELGCFMNSCGV